MCVLKRALEAWQARMEVVRCCEEMGAMRSRRILQERTTVCFVLWSEGVAQQRIAGFKVGLLTGFFRSD